MHIFYFFFFIFAYIARSSDGASLYSQHGSETQMWKQQAETNLVKYLLNDHKSIVYRCQLFGTTRPSMYVHLLTILLANDVALNPGPVANNSTNSSSSYPCGTCEKPVNWSHRGIVCDTCNQWYHVSCQSMTSSLYNHHINDSAAAWDCIMCGCPKFSTFCYTQVFSTNKIIQCT